MKARTNQLPNKRQTTSRKFNPISIKHLAKNLELASYEQDWRQMKRGQHSTGCCARGTRIHWWNYTNANESRCSSEISVVAAKLDLFRGQFHSVPGICFNVFILRKPPLCSHYTSALNHCLPHNSGLINKGNNSFIVSMNRCNKDVIKSYVMFTGIVIIHQVIMFTLPFDLCT